MNCEAHHGLFCSFSMVIFLRRTVRTQQISHATLDSHGSTTSTPTQPTHEPASTPLTLVLSLLTLGLAIPTTKSHRPRLEPQASLLHRLETLRRAVFVYPFGVVGRQAYRWQWDRGGAVQGQEGGAGFGWCSAFGDARCGRDAADADEAGGDGRSDGESDVVGQVGKRVLGSLLGQSFVWAFFACFWCWCAAQESGCG